MRTARRPGQPLAALGLIMGAWIIARIVVWQGPLPFGPALAMSEAGSGPALAVAAPAPTATRPAGAPAAPLTKSLASGADLAEPRAGAPSLAANRLGEAFLAPIASSRDGNGVERAIAAPAALPNTPAIVLPATLQERPMSAPAARLAEPLVREPAGRALPALARWSGGGWLLLRGGAAGTLAAGAGVGRYGGSQAGAGASYSLGRSDRRPALYVRTTAALRGAADRELALGASARPFPAVPVRAQLELRARDSSGRIQFSPAALAVSELPLVHLPGRMRAEGYLQAGYVAGEFATAFVGGDLRIDRSLAELEGVRIRAGAGVWGGAQRGAAALDVGPGVTLETDLAGAPVRLALDYRVRVAGAAEPRSGPALTISTGF